MRTCTADLGKGYNPAAYVLADLGLDYNIHVLRRGKSASGGFTCRDELSPPRIH